MKQKNIKAIIIYNKPLYELHILEEKDPHFTRLLRQKHLTTQKWKEVYEQHRNTLESVEKSLKLLGIQTEKIYRKEMKKVDHADLVVTVGGDGTFLETSHYVKKAVLLGVNAAPIDSTGALCRARQDNFLSMIVDWLSGSYQPKKVERLQVKIDKKILPFPVLNDILFANRCPAGTSRYLIQQGKNVEEHKSSGVWIASPTGSTAAICSAGGKKLPLESTNFEFVVRELFCHEQPKAKLLSGILSKKQKLIFYPRMRQAALYLDGSHLEVSVPYGARIEIGLGPYPLRAMV